MILDAITQNQIPPSPFSAETLQKIEEGTIVDISDRPINTGGAYGDLFSGYHTVLGLKVAMKRPRELLRRSFREGHTWMIFRDIQHPNILPFLGIYEHEAHHHLVSPFMENGTLDVYLAEYPEADRGKLLRQAAGGLAHMHGLKIVHGDIKANNILVTPHGRVFVCDFGLSQIVELRTVDGAYSITSLGNLRWASPESIESEQDDCEDIPKTFQGDVWAFGLTIYQVLSGRLPYAGKRDLAIIKAILAGALPEQEPLSSPSGVPYDFLWEISSQCLRKRPSERISMLEAAICLGDNYDREVSSFEKTVKLDRMLVANHPRHGMVVLKRFRRTPQFRENGLPYSNFQVELWASLMHPNILPFLGVCVVGLSRRPFLMSSHMDQGAIQEYIGAHPEKNRLELLVQAAQGLRYLHEELIVHGEVRAEKFLMSGIGRVLLSGFGSSALVGGTSIVTAGLPTQFARWQSPEVLKCGSKTFASDVYAFGMTIYEVLSGQTPFADLQSDEEVMLAVLRHDSRPPYWGDPTLSDRYKDTWTIVGKCWIPEWYYRPLILEVIHELKKAESTTSLEHKTINTVKQAFAGLALSNVHPKTNKNSQRPRPLDTHGQHQGEDVPNEVYKSLGKHRLSQNEQPVTHLQYESPLICCPIEVLVKILANISGLDLMMASLACRFLRQVIHYTAVLQYHIGLFGAGLIDQGIDSEYISVQDRLDGLRQQEDRWRTLDWRRSDKMHTAGTCWDLKGGAYISAIYERESLSFSFKLGQFASLWRDRPEPTEVIHNNIRIESFDDFTIDVDQDLLIIFEKAVSVGSEETDQGERSIQRLEFPMHVRSLSGNIQHPSAEVEKSSCFIEFPAGAEAPQISDYSPRVSGNLVAIAIGAYGDQAEPGNVIIWRWTDAVQLLVIRTFTATAEFLSATVLVTTGVDVDDNTVLHIYELPTSVSRLGFVPEPGITSPSVVLKLPRLKPDSKLHRYPVINSNPQPAGHQGANMSPSPTFPSPCSRTFGLRTDPENRIITFNWINLVLVVHASTLLKYCKPHTKGSRSIISWNNWSHRTRWLSGSTGRERYCTFGQKYVTSSPRHDYQLGEDASMLRILDFNPHTIAREGLLGEIVFKEKEDEEAVEGLVQSGHLGPARAYVVTGPSGFEDEMFEETQRYSLPYLETTSTKIVGGFDDVMITEEHVVIRGFGGFTVEALSF